MEYAHTPEQQVPPGKVYREKAMYAATFLGGPLVAGYMIANNFKVFNDPVKAKKAWLYAVTATILILGSGFLIPHFEKIPRFLIPALYTLITACLVRAFQRRNLHTFLNSGGAAYGLGRAICISVIGVLVMIAAIFLTIFSIKALAPARREYADVRTYGITKNEVYFNRHEISGSEAEEIAGGLAKTSFFNGKQTR